MWIDSFLNIKMVLLQEIGAIFTIMEKKKSDIHLNDVTVFG